MNFALLLLVCATISFAKDPFLAAKVNCSSIDNRNQILGTVRDQKEINWCYAFAAADMLAYENDIFVRISAADVAINYNESFAAQSLRRISTTFGGETSLPHQTGFAKVALNSYQKLGYCPESVMPSEMWTKFTRTSHGWVESKQALKDSMLDIYKLYKEKKKLSAKNIPFYFRFKNVDLRAFVQLIQNYQLEDFYSKLSLQVCENDRLPFPETYKAKMVIRNPRIFSTIDEILEKGHLVSVDFDYRVLEKNSHVGVNFEQLHTTNLVGRRWNAKNNTCEYLIRDSYGTSCADYDPMYSCEEGNVWVDRERLFKSMTSIVFL